MGRHILIDADIIAYKASSVNEERFDWGEGVTTVVADEQAAQRSAKLAIEELSDTLKGDPVICLSDDFDNFRLDVDPTYKTNRKSSQRPEHLYDIKDWMKANYKTKTAPRWEADDVMGVLATEPHKGERIIVSEDKDMMTIPALVYRPQCPKLGILDITPIEAIRFLFWQTICGDPTDGYSGAKGVGKKSPHAEDALLADTEVDAWDCVLDAYSSVGSTERKAVQQCNLARILKYGDAAGNRVIPWVPPYDPERGN